MDNTKERQTRSRAVLQEMIWSYKETHPCIDCGEADPIVLEFDHRDPKQKLFLVSQAIVVTRNPQVILDEIGKCDIRCANCHRRRTVREKHWEHRFNRQDHRGRWHYGDGSISGGSKK